MKLKNIGFLADEECQTKILRIAAHNNVVSGGASAGIRLAIDAAYAALKPKMADSVLAMKIPKTKKKS